MEPADTDFLALFETCALPEREWTHAAHIRVAWVYLNLESSGQVLARIRDSILRYNTEVLNRPHKYHETVTVAFTRLVADRMREGESWVDFAERINDIVDPVNPILLRYYSADRLFSEEARMQFVEADLQELPSLGID